MLEASNTNSKHHRFMEFDYRFHKKFFESNFQMFHGCYTKEPFGYAIFDAIDYGKLPIIHTDWMNQIDYKYRANNKDEFYEKYLEIQNNSFDELRLEFNKLKNGLNTFINKTKWVTEICKVLSI
jgi:hypothetical protein